MIQQVTTLSEAKAVIKEEAGDAYLRPRVPNLRIESKSYILYEGLNERFLEETHDYCRLWSEWDDVSLIRIGGDLHDKVSNIHEALSLVFVSFYLGYLPGTDVEKIKAFWEGLEKIVREFSILERKEDDNDWEQVS